MSSVAPDTSLLDRLDEGLAGLRRVWTHPDRKRRFMAELGVPVELAVLRTLRAVEIGLSEGDSVGVIDVAEQLQVTPSTASRLLDQAVQQGYAARRPSDRDRRRADLELTEAGLALLQRAREVRRGMLAEVTKDWTAAEIEQLTELLHRLEADVRQLSC